MRRNRFTIPAICLLAGLLGACGGGDKGAEASPAVLHAGNEGE